MFFIKISQPIAYIVDDMSKCSGQKCCDFRSKLTDGLTAQMQSQVLNYLAAIRDEINKELNWDVDGISARCKKNALALVQVHQMLIQLLLQSGISGSE
jgi:hypothetical protein